MKPLVHRAPKFGISSWFACQSSTYQIMFVNATYLCWYSLQLCKSLVDSLVLWASSLPEEWETMEATRLMIYWQPRSIPMLWFSCVYWGLLKLRKTLESFDDDRKKFTAAVPDVQMFWDTSLRGGNLVMTLAISQASRYFHDLISVEKEELWGRVVCPLNLIHALKSRFSDFDI